MAFQDTLYLLHEWAGEGKVTVGGYYDETTSILKIRVGPLSHGFPSYLFLVNTTGRVTQINHDQYPEEIIFSDPARLTLGDTEDLVCLGVSMHVHIKRSGKISVLECPR